MKISRKPFSLDPNLGSMKDNITSTSKQMNWNIIVKELKVTEIDVLKSIEIWDQAGWREEGQDH